MKRKIFTLIAVALITIQLSTPVFATISNGDFNETSFNENEENTSEDYFKDEIVEHKDTGKYGSLPPASVQVQIDNGTITLNNRLTRAGATGIWQLQSNGKWKFLFTVSANGNIAGTYATNQWNSIGDKWYHFDSSGYRQEGWFKDVDGLWYYLNPGDGSMRTNWILVSGKWYFMNDRGAMQVGWQTIDGKKYFFHSIEGDMRIGWYQVGSKWYYFNSSGAMVTGWVLVSGRWYYLNSSGAMETTWISDKGKIYYLDPKDGYMRVEWVYIVDKWYYFNSSGVMQTGWNEISRPGFLGGNKYWNYFSLSGVLMTDSDVKGRLGYATFNDHRNTTGLTLTYNIGLAQNYAAEITTAVNSWNNSSRARLTQTTNTNTDITIVVATLSTGVMGYAEHYVNNKVVDPENKDWTRGQIYISPSNSIASAADIARTTGTIAHELGHIFGLSHRISNQRSIMCQIGNGRTVSSPQATDVEVLHHLY